VVVDASVGVKWFVDEESTDHALRLAKDYEARAVDIRSTQLFPFEVLNTLRYNPDMGNAEVERAGEALSRLRIALYPILGELKSACLKKAYERGMTVYDASYVALGELLGSGVYTADAKMLDKTRGEGKVHHIRDYRAPGIKRDSPPKSTDLNEG
jgi:predicted nucleic acid-binding protein